MEEETAADVVEGVAGSHRAAVTVEAGEEGVAAAVEEEETEVNLVDEVGAVLTSRRAFLHARHAFHGSADVDFFLACLSPNFFSPPRRLAHPSPAASVSPRYPRRE